MLQRSFTVIPQQYQQCCGEAMLNLIKPLDFVYSNSSRLLLQSVADRLRPDCPFRRLY